MKKFLWIFLVSILFFSTTFAANNNDLSVCPLDQSTMMHHMGRQHHFCHQNHAMHNFSKIKTFHVNAFRYGYKPSTIKVKLGDEVHLIVRSLDVTHGIYIKEYGINVKVSKGQQQLITFKADKEGKFDIICSVYCGPGHRSMHGVLVVSK